MLARINLSIVAVFAKFNFWGLNVHFLCVLGKNSSFKL
jgi:hypothetical protein